MPDSEIRALIERLVIAGVDPVDAAEVVARAAIHGAANTPKTRSAGAVRQERYRRNKASQVTESDGSDAVVTESDGEPGKEKSPAPSKETNQLTLIKTTPIGVAKEPAKKPKRTPARSKLPDDWFPDEAGFTFATERGIPESVAYDEIEKFKDHHKANGSVMADWPAAWRKWVQNHLKFEAERQARAKGWR